MAEIRRGFGGEPAGNGERLPWLEPVEDEDDYPQAGGLGGIALLALAALIGVAVLVTAVVMVRHWRASRADIGQVIHAPTTPYKVKPVNPGGLTVDGSGAVAERTGTGSDIDAPLDLANLPEQPVAGAGAAPASPAPAAQPVATPAAKPVPVTPSVASAPVPARPVPLPAPAPVAKAEPTKPAARPLPATPPAERTVAAPAAGGGGTIQLGAFSSEAKARAAWKTLSARFAYLAPLTMAISPVQSGDKTLYRLRAGGGPAAQLCGRLHVAGETCAVVD